MVAAAFGRLVLSKSKGQILVVLTLGILMMLVVVFSSMRDGEENEGEVRTKTLVYDTDPSGKIGLYWTDGETNKRKATLEEIERCEKLHPDEAVPICQTTYYEENKNKK